MIDVKRFSGILNTDDNNADILPVQHIAAKNGKFYGGQNGTFQNIKGNYLIANSNLPGGTNECIGAVNDQVKKRIIWFNYNSYGNNGIYQLSIQTGLVTQIFRSGVNSATDFLRFSLDFPICSVGIVYRTEGDGDLLYWTDGNSAAGNRPRYINLDTVSALSPFTEDMINAAKDAPLAPLSCSFQDDAAVNSNNFKKKMVRVIYRWGYKSGDKSTWSPISAVPLPVDGYDPDTQNDPTLNNNILIPVIAGGDDYQTIEIAVQFNINNTWGNFQLVDSLDRDEYSITPGSTYNYYFYNNGSYPTIEPESTDLYFSWLPDYANTLELLNGNVLIYGGLTDGYDKVAREDVDVVITSGSTASGVGVPSISWQPSGGWTIIVYIGATITVGAIYNISFSYDYDGSSGGFYNKSQSYTTILGNTQDSIVNSLKTLLDGSNIICTNLGAGYLQIEVDTGVGKSISDTVTTVSGISGTTASAPAYNWATRYVKGLVYFDDRGKTNGVVSFVGSTLDTTDFAVTTPLFSTTSNVVQVPFISASINHTPPSWATAYQWVRTPTGYDFLQYITNDYQTDTDFLYICIQDLIYQKEKNSGFVPSYEFTEGDHVKVMASYNSGTGFYTPYNIQLDFEILGVVDRPMTSPASTGKFLKVAKPSTLPSVAYSAKMLIEIYTPPVRLNDEQQLFYEWGQKYDIYTSSGIRYHRGQLTDQTESQPATFTWTDGDVYFKERELYIDVDATTTKTVFLIDPNYSDYFVSAVSSNGRGWVIDNNAKQDYNQVLVRWGGKYQSGTNINELNIFRPSDFDEVDRSKGDIRRFKVRDRILRVFQDRGCGQYGVYARFIQNNEGNTELVTTNEIITTNNINYYQGTYGLSGYPTNLCSTPIADYFNDVVTGREVRLSGDGITDLGLLYKGQFTLSGYVTPYNKELLRSNGSIAKVMKYWDSFENEAHTILQAGTANGTTTTDRNYSFNETRNAFCCDEYDEHPEWAVSADDTVYLWKNGRIYKRSELAPYCNFFGLQYDCSIDVVFNPNIGEKKGWQSIAEVASDIWHCPTIYTDTKTYGSQRQESNLVAAEFTVLEGMPSSSFKRDSYSRGGKLNGDTLKGQYIVVKFQKTNASSLVTLNEVLVRYVDSPLNVR